MFSRRGFLSGLLVLSSLLSLIPAAAADSGPSLSDFYAAPAGTTEVLLAAAGPSGAMLAATTGSSFVQFHLFSGDDAAAAPQRLVRFELAMGTTPSDLAQSRLVARSPSDAFLVFERDGAVRLAGFDPVAGAQRFDVALSQAGERAQMPSAALVGDSLYVSFLSSSPSGRAFVVVAVDPESGTVVSRAAIAPSTARAGTLVTDGEHLYLALLTGTSLSVSAYSGGALQQTGTVVLSASAGALWARHGAVGALLATPSGLVRLSALLPDLRQQSQVSVAGTAGVTSVAARAAWDGRMAAVAVGSAGAVLITEPALSQFQISTANGVRAAAVAGDAFGMVRASLLMGSSQSSMVRGFTAGTASGVEVSVSGPASLLPMQTGAFEVTLRAVRTPVTVVGLVASAPSGWQAQVPDIYATLAPGATHSLTLHLTVPAGTAPGLYSVSLTPASLEVSAPEPFAFGVGVAPAGGISAAMDSGSLSLRPGESQVVVINLQNRGSSPEVANVVGTAPAGLSLQPPTAEITVAPGATVAVNFVVSAPGTARPLEGEPLAFDVQTTDGMPATHLVRLAGVQEQFEPVLVAERTAISGAPGAVVPIPLTVENHGNTAGLVYLTSELTGLPADALMPSSEVLVVPAFGRASVSLAVAVPGDALWGRAFAVTVSASFEGGAGLAEATFSGSVLQAVALSAGFGGGEPMAPGATTSGVLSIANAGNRGLLATLVFLPGSGDVTARVTSGVTGGILVPAFSSVEIPIELTAGPRAAAGPTAPVVRLLTDAAAPIEVAMPANVLASHALGLRLLTPSFTVTDPRVTSVAAQFEVSNGGNGEEPVNIIFDKAPTAFAELTADGRVVSANPLTPVVVPAFASRVFRAVLPLDLAPSATSAQIPVRVESHAGQAADATVSVSRPLADPRALDMSVTPLFAPARAGELHRVLVNLTNEGASTSAALSAVLSVDGRVVLTQPVEPLPRGARRLVAFEFVPLLESQQVSVAVRSDPPGFDADTSNNELSIPYEVAAAARAEPSLPEKAVAPAAVSFSLLALIAVALTEVGKSTFISLFFLPLYVKLKPEEVLDQYLRGQIHGYIIANPGEHYNAIKEQLGVTNGALAYHLRVLERSEYIRAVRDGMYKRFYPMGVKIPKRRRLSTFQDTIVKTVRDNPALSQKEIAERLGVSNQVINYHVKQLETANILRLERDGRGSRLFLGPEAPPAEPAPPAPVAPPAPSP